MMLHLSSTFGRLKSIRAAVASQASQVRAKRGWTGSGRHLPTPPNQGGPTRAVPAALGAPSPAPAPRCVWRPRRQPLGGAPGALLPRQGGWSPPALPAFPAASSSCRPPRLRRWPTGGTPPSTWLRCPPPPARRVSALALARRRGLCWPAGSVGARAWARQQFGSGRSHRTECELHRASGVATWVHGDWWA